MTSSPASMRLVCDGLGRAVRCLSRLRLRGLRPGRVILAARDEQDAGRDGRHEGQRRQENGDLCALGHAGLLFRGLIFLRLRLRDRRGFRFGLRGRLRLGRGHFQFFVFVVFQIHNVSRFPNDAPIISHHTGLFNAFSRRGVNFLSTFARAPPDEHAREIRKRPADGDDHQMPTTPMAGTAESA